MEWELDTALANGIPVIGVVPKVRSGYLPWFQQEQ